MTVRFIFAVSILTLSLFQARISPAQNLANYNLKDSSLIFYYYFSPDSLSLNSPPTLFDTLPNNAQRYDAVNAPDKFYANTGNTGRATNPLWYKPNLQPGFDIGMHSHDPYLFHINSIPYFSIFYPMSRIKYLMGPKKELLLDLLHNQNIGKYFTLGLDVHAMKSPGVYLNQLSEQFNCYSTLTYKTKNKRYRVSGGVLYNYLRNGENGGIVTDSLFEKNLETNRQLIPVKLEKARSLFKETGAFITQEFDIFKQRKIISDSAVYKLSSILPNKIRLAAIYNRQAWHYDDEGNHSDYYPFPAQDTSITRDLTETDSYRANLFLFHTVNKTFPLSYYGKLAYRTDMVKDAVLNKTEIQWLGAAGIGLPLPLEFHAGLDWEQQIYGLYAKGDQKTQLYLEKGIWKAEQKLLLRIDYTFTATTPSYFLQSYHSNYFNWDNSFSKIKHSIYSFSLKYRGYRIEISQNEVSRPVVLLPSNAIPWQSSDKIKIQEISFDKVFHFWYLVLDNEIRYQHVSDDILIHLPAFVSRHAFYFDLKLFNNALNLQPGFDVNFQSENYGDYYMPALRSFYLQFDKKLSSQAYVDFFVNMKISRAVLSLSYTHLDAAVGNGKYYQTPGYPMPDAGLKFGVNWLLRDAPEPKKPVESD